MLCSLCSCDKPIMQVKKLFVYLHKCCHFSLQAPKGQPAIRFVGLRTRCCFLEQENQESWQQWQEGTEVRKASARGKSARQPVNVCISMTMRTKSSGPKRVEIVKERTCFCSTLWPKSQRMVEAYEILQSDKSFVRLLLTSSIGLLRRIAATIQRGTWRRKSMLMLARATFMASVA